MEMMQRSNVKCTRNALKMQKKLKFILLFLFNYFQGKQSNK